jgi:hypothetical protein
MYRLYGAYNCRLLCTVCMVHTTALYDTQTDYETPHYTAVAWYSQIIFINDNHGSTVSDIYIAKVIATCFGCYFSHFQASSRLVQVKGKGKAVPLQAWSGPEGSRKLRFPDYMTTAQDGGKVVSLMHRPPLRPGNAPGTHFC